MSDRRAEPPQLIERDADLDLIAAALDSAVGGSGTGVLIRGAAGMGKTALVDACGDLARRRGMQVFAARGGLLEHEFAFGVVRQLLAPLAVQPDLRARALREAGAGAAAVLADDEAAPAVPDGTFSLTYSIFWALTNVAADVPLCLLVDDLQHVTADGVVDR